MEKKKKASEFFNQKKVRFQFYSECEIPNSVCFHFY